MSSIKLAAAFDQKSKSDFLRALDLFVGLPVVVKVGLRLMPLLDSKDYGRIKSMGFEFFADAKLHDIPSQVSDSAKSWAALGADYLTLHLSGGPRMLEAATEAVEGSSLKLVGVSVLSSLSQTELEEMGFEGSLESRVINLMNLGVDSGLEHAVCAAADLAWMPKTIRGRLEMICPGIHLSGGPAQSDQSRSLGLDQALTLTPHMVVIGRAIFSAPDPRALVSDILKRF